MNQKKTRKVYKRKESLRSDGAVIALRCDAQTVADLKLLSDAMDGANYTHTITRLVSDVAKIVRQQSVGEDRDWEEMSETRRFKTRLFSQFQLWNRK